LGSCRLRTALPQARKEAEHLPEASTMMELRSPSRPSAWRTRRVGFRRQNRPMLHRRQAWLWWGISASWSASWTFSPCDCNKGLEYECMKLLDMAVCMRISQNGVQQIPSRLQCKSLRRNASKHNRLLTAISSLLPLPDEPR